MLLFFLLARKAMTNTDSILKGRDVTLPTKVHLVKARLLVFPVVMYGCERWTIKMAKHPRIDVFELWYWRTVESPLNCKIKLVNPKGKLTLNSYWKNTEAEAPTPSPPDSKSRLTGNNQKTVMLRKIEGKRRE